MTIRRKRFACRVPKVTNTPSQYVNLHFHCNNGCMNGPQCYILRTLPVLLELYPSLTHIYNIAFRKQSVLPFSGARNEPK